MGVIKKVSPIRLPKTGPYNDLKTDKEMRINGQTRKELTYGHPKTQIHKRVHYLSRAPNSTLNANWVTVIAFDEAWEGNLKSKRSFIRKNIAYWSVKKPNRGVPVWIWRDGQVFQECERTTGRVLVKTARKGLEHGNHFIGAVEFVLNRGQTP